MSAAAGDTSTQPPYDEFGMLQQNAEEAGLPWTGPPVVERRFVEVGGGRNVSAILWGSEPPQVVFLHGGAQNAHTWDTVALALGRPMMAVDMPGHGHSGWRADGDYSVTGMADDVVRVIQELAPTARLLVGMGLGSPVSLLETDRLGRQIERLVMVDSASGARRPAPADEDADAPPRESAAGANVREFTTGQRVFASFDELLERTMRYNRGRSEQSLRRGALHNARQLDDGTWTWRWDPAQAYNERSFNFEELEHALDRFSGPVLLMRGELSDIVTDEVVAAFTERHRDTRIETVAGAGHGVQGDRPLEVARLISAELDLL